MPISYMKDEVDMKYKTRLTQDMAGQANEQLIMVLSSLALIVLLYLIL